MRQPKPTRQLVTPDDAVGSGTLRAHEKARLRHEAEGWRQRAEELAQSLGAALAAPEPSARLIACVNRAYRAWHPGVTYEEIARTTRVIERAREAITYSTSEADETAYLLCAQVTHRNLPRTVRDRCSVTDVTSVVRRLAKEPIDSLAVRGAVMQILGWQANAEDWASDLIRFALEDHPNETGPAK